MVQPTDETAESIFWSMRPDPSANGTSAYIEPSLAMAKLLVRSAPTTGELTQVLASAKASAVASTLDDGLVIGCDSMLDLAGRAYGKPASPEEAEARLAEERALATAAAERVQALGGGGPGPDGVSQLRAPVAGVVAERHVSAGQSVGPSLVAFRVGDLDDLWVVLTVFERHIGLLRKGDAVDIRPVNDESKHIRGTIAHVGTVLDPGSRTARVRVDVTNIGDEPQYFFGDNQSVFDANDRKFAADTTAAIYLEDSSSFIEEINPGNTVKGTLVFDLPKDVDPTRIELHDSAFSGGVVVDLG